LLKKTTVSSYNVSPVSPYQSGDFLATRYKALPCNAMPRGSASNVEGVQYKKVRSCNRNPCCANKHQLFYEYRTWDVDVPSLLADLTRNKAEALLRTVPRGSSSPRFMEQTIPHP